MKYFVRPTNAWDYHGPYTLEEIQELIPSTIDPVDSLVIIAAGQSHQKLVYSGEWFPIADILADAKPLIQGRAPQVSRYESLRSTMEILAILSHLIVSFVALRVVFIHFRSVDVDRVFWGLTLLLVGNFVIFALKHVVLILTDILSQQKRLPNPPGMDP